MPYKPTGRPNGRPPKARNTAGLLTLSAKLNTSARRHRMHSVRLSASARRHQDEADRRIVKALATRTYKQLADELNVSVGFIRNAVRRYKRREVRKQSA
jgi:hypothetical protein